MGTRLNSDRDNAESIAASWIARRECDDWSNADEVALKAWIDADVNHRVAWLRLEAAWQHTNRLKSLSTPASTRVPARDEMHLPFFESASQDENEIRVTKRKSIPVMRWPAIAASFVAVALIAAGMSLWPRQPSYQTEIGALQAVALPDGSRVTLNTDTEIQVAVTKAERRVSLRQGEAYFEVAKDSSRPFIVEADKKRIVAVGTQFAVRRSAGHVRITVTEGAVRVEAGGPDQPVLHAGAIARAGAQGVLVQRKPIAEAEQALSWRSGYLVFDRTPLADAVAEFNRYNVRQIRIEDPAVATVPVGGNFRVVNVDAFLRLIESELSIVSIQRGNHIVLRGSARSAVKN